MAQITVYNADSVHTGFSSRCHLQLIWLFDLDSSTYLPDVSMSKTLYRRALVAAEVSQREALRLQLILMHHPAGDVCFSVEPRLTNFLFS